MNDYTPKTHEIRAASVIHRAALIHRQMTGKTIRDAERVSLAEFDRWLAEVERAAAEKAWGEGVRDESWSREYGETPDNPYRKGNHDDQS